MDGVLDAFNWISISWWNYVVLIGWQAAFVGTVVLLLVHFLGQRWPAPLRYAFLVLALLKFACPPLLPVPTGLFTHITPPRVMLPLVQERKPAQASRSHSVPSDAALAERVSRRLGSIHWTGWLMLIHGAGTVTVLVLVARQIAAVRALIRNSSRLFGGFLGEEYRDLALLIGVSRIPRLAVSGQVDGPIAFGLKQPAIMLPSRILARLQPGEIKAVLAHELAHCQRGDLWLIWVQLLLAAVWWFHPVLWLVNRSLRDIREDCCDDLILARGVIANDAYCDVLLRAASELCPPAPLTGSLALGGRLHPLGRRLARITDWSLERTDTVSIPGAIVVLLGAALLLPGASNPSIGHESVHQGPVDLGSAHLPAAPLPALAALQPIQSSRVALAQGPATPLAPLDFASKRSSGETALRSVAAKVDSGRAQVLGGAPISVAAPPIPSVPTSPVPAGYPRRERASSSVWSANAPAFGMVRSGLGNGPRVRVFVQMPPATPFPSHARWMGPPVAQARHVLARSQGDVFVSSQVARAADRIY